MEGMGVSRHAFSVGATNIPACNAQHISTQIMHGTSVEPLLSLDHLSEQN